MRGHKIVTRTLLILFIVNQVVNFVFGAPVAAREKLEGHIDVDVTEDGTAALQKRVNPVDKGSTNMVGQTPSSPDQTELDQLWKEISEQGNMFMDSPTPLHIPGWSTPPFSNESPTESMGSNSPHMSPSPPTSPPPSLPEERLPPAWSLTTDTLSTTGHKTTPQQSSGPDLDVHPPPNPEPHPLTVAGMPIGESLEMLMKGLTKPLQPPPRS
jgi:hypothetical protein